MRRSGARAGQWPHRSTSLAHFKSLQVVLKGFHMPSKSSFPPSYCCTWQMDTVKNFLFESILPFKKTVVNIPCSQNCIGQQSLGGVHPWQVFWDNWQLQDHEVRTFLYWIPSRPFPTVNMQLSLSLSVSLCLWIILCITEYSGWEQTNLQAALENDAENNGLNQFCFLLQTLLWLLIVSAYLFIAAAFLWKKFGLLTWLSLFWNDKWLHPGCQ